MASHLHITNDIQWATILCALPVSPQTFLQWSQLERLSFLANLTQQPQWQVRPYMIKIFGHLLQLPQASQPPRLGELTPPLEPDQSLPETPEEALLVDASGTPASGQEASQRQSTVFETWTKNPLVDEWALPIVVRLPQHTLTSYEHVFAHLPLLRTCHSTPRPHNIILQAPCDLSIPWAMELTVCSQDTRRGLTEYQP